MPPKTQIGTSIRARFTAHYRETLSASEKAQARRVLRHLRRTTEDGRGAKGSVLLPGRGNVEVSVSNGAIVIGGGATQVEAAGASVFETVCAAAGRGLFNVNGQSQDSRDGGGSSGGDGTSGGGADGSQGGQADGDASGNQGADADGGQGSGDGGDGQDGDGDADGDSDGGGDDPAQDQGDGEDGGEDASQGAQGASQDKARRDDPEHDLEHLYRRLDELADFLDSSDGEDAPKGDTVSARPYLDGEAMLWAGIPVSGILHAWAINWTPTARQAAGIQDYDPATFRPTRNRHKLYGYIRALIEAGVPPFLKGPTQAGTSAIFREVAADCGLDFSANPMTAGLSPSVLLGAWTPDGFVSVPFPRAYEGGGLHLFDELDASEPNLTIVLNDALANGSLFNPRTGQEVKRHPRFVAGAAANTWLTGAAEGYTGRYRQDKALCERLRMGRVAFGYDRELYKRIGRDKRAQRAQQAPDYAAALAGVK
jgi:hypothetical protein